MRKAPAPKILAAIPRLFGPGAALKTYRPGFTMPRAVVDGMSKMRSAMLAKGRTKHGGPALTKREELALAFRRLIIRQGAAEEKARARLEAKSEARYKRGVSRRENTKALAAERVKACQRHPSPHAIGQLAAIAGNAAMSPDVRVGAAAALLLIGFGLPSSDV